MIIIIDNFVHTKTNFSFVSNKQTIHYFPVHSFLLQIDALLNVQHSHTTLSRHFFIKRAQTFSQEKVCAARS